MEAGKSEGVSWFTWEFLLVVLIKLVAIFVAGDVCASLGITHVLKHTISPLHGPRIPMTIEHRINSSPDSCGPKAPNGDGNWDEPASGDRNPVARDTRLARVRLGERDNI